MPADDGPGNGSAQIWGQRQTQSPGAGIGDRIRSRRLELGLSVRALARRLRRPHSVLSRWESGIREPTLLDLRRLGRILGVSLESLFTDVAKMPVGRRWSSRAYSPRERRHIAQRLAAARLASGIPLREARRLAGIPTIRLLAIEGGADPSLEEVRRLRLLLGVDLDDLALPPNS